MFGIAIANKKILSQIGCDKNYLFKESYVILAFIICAIPAFLFSSFQYNSMQWYQIKVADDWIRTPLPTVPQPLLYITLVCLTHSNQTLAESICIRSCKWEAKWLIGWINFPYGCLQSAKIRRKMASRDNRLSRPLSKDQRLMRCRQYKDEGGSLMNKLDRALQPTAWRVTL